jgi:hypothetical protein
MRLHQASERAASITWAIRSHYCVIQRLLSTAPSSHPYPEFQSVITELPLSAKCKSGLNLTRLGVAAGFAELSVLQYAVDTGLVLRLSESHSSASFCKGAALAGDLVKLQWLYTKHRCSISTAVSVRAASCGHVAILRWLARVTKDKVVRSGRVIKAAC